MSSARPLSDDFRKLTDEEVERRAHADPDAGDIPAGFWANAEIVDPEAEYRVTLSLDPEVARWFRSQGTGYRARMNAVLKSYVEARKKAG